MLFELVSDCDAPDEYRVVVPLLDTVCDQFQLAEAEVLPLSDRDELNKVSPPV
jgi:hypothetical protein